MNSALFFNNRGVNKSGPQALSGDNCDNSWNTSQAVKEMDWMNCNTEVTKIKMVRYQKLATSSTEI